MKGFLIFLLIVALIAGALYLTRPDQADFNNYIQEEIQANTSKNVPQGGRYSTNKKQEVTSTIEDYYVFTVIEAKVDDDERTYVGLIGQFFPI
jgi:hypothetical protein